MLKIDLRLQSPPEFLVKSALGVTLVTFVIIIPFAIHSFIQGRHLLGILACTSMLACAINVWFCARGEYHWKINCFFLAPIIIVSVGALVQILGVKGTPWAFMGVLGFCFLLPERLAWIINPLLILVALFIAKDVLEFAVFIRFMVMLVLTNCLAAIFIRIITKQQLELRENAVTDALTGVYNRSLLEDTLNHVIQQHRRTDEPVTLITLDVDHFKKVNDTHGHDAGDQVLKQIADLLKNRLRATDKIFRLGGEEFLILLYKTDKADSEHIAEEIRQYIASIHFVNGLSVTASMGIATLKDGESILDWLKRSDGNLYQAKLEGRNKVVA